MSANDKQTTGSPTATTDQAEVFVDFKEQKFAKGVPLSPQVRLFRFLGSPRPDWQEHIRWSMQDAGPVEAEIQTQWAHLDAVYPKTFLVERCLRREDSRGRATAMAIALDAAHSKFDQKAFDITVSTQLHSHSAVVSIQAAGVWTVAEYLRSGTP